jgi:hypothetical protein
MSEEEEFIGLQREDDEELVEEEKGIFTEEDDDDDEIAVVEEDVKPVYPVESVAELALDLTERLIGKKKEKRLRLADALIKTNIIDSSMRTISNPVVSVQKMNSAEKVNGIAEQASKKLLEQVKKAEVKVVPKEQKQKKADIGAAASSEWFGIKSMANQPGAREAIELLRMRGYMDSKKFFKKDTKLEKGILPQVFQLGTVVAGAHEFYSSRLSKKERAPSIVDEILRDKNRVQFVKRKFEDVRQKNPIKKPMKPFAKRPQKRQRK